MLRRTALVLTAIVAASVASTPSAPGRAAPAPPVKEKELVTPTPSIEARFTDGSVMKLAILDAKLLLETPYGKLTIPVADIHEIEFATRIPDAASRQALAAIADLGSSTFATREAASKKLEKLQRLAYPALLKVEEDKDPEVRKRAGKLLEAIRRAVPADRLKVVPHDVIHTNDSKIAGRIVAASFKGETAQFGEVEVKLAHLMSLRSLAHGDREAVVAAAPGPMNLTAHQGMVGKTFVFTVTGAVGPGTVWGTDVYTLDSTLAAAAVHAGVLQVGKTGNVTVKILGPLNAFNGTLRNGVQSHPFNMYPGTYEFVKKR